MARKLFLILLIPAILIIAGYLFLRFSFSGKIKEEEKTTGKVEVVDSLGGKKVSKADLRPLFIERMQQLLKKSSEGLYNLQVGNMEIDVLASTVSLKNVTVKSDEKILAELKNAGRLPDNVFDFSFASLVIDGINVDDAITKKTMDYRLIKLVSPVIHVYRQQFKKGKEEKKEDFSQRFLQEMEKLSINRLVIEDGTIVAHGSGKKINSLNNVQVNMNNILLDSTTRRDKNRFLFAKEATINFSDYSTQSKDGLYNFKIGKGELKAPQQQLNLQQISFTSPFSHEQFMKRQKLAKELFNFSMASVSLQKVDWWTVLNGEELVAENLLAKNGKLSIYFDRSLPPRSKMGNFPNQLLAKLPMKMNLEKIQLQNIDLAYTEYNPVSKEEGAVYVDDISLNGTNVSTTNKTPLVINGTGRLMRKVPLNASFTFDMSNPRTGGFSAAISSDQSFDASILNAFTMPLGMVKIEKGTVQKLKASMKGDEHSASGDVLVLYNNLKVELLEKDKGKKELDKKDVTSFLANLLVIKNDNPKGNKEPRKETAFFRRDQTGGFVMLVWKTILVGALKTIGAPEKLASKKPTPK